MMLPETDPRTFDTASPRASAGGLDEVVHRHAADRLRLEVRLHPGGDLLRRPAPAVAADAGPAADEPVHLRVGDVLLDLREGRGGVAAVEAADRHDRQLAGELVAG